MSTRILPDIEQAVITYLLDQPEVAFLVGDRIWATVPEGAVFPYLEVFLVSGRPESYHWVGKALLQISGWSYRGLATARADARDACEQAVASLQDARNTEVGDCLIAAVEDILTPRPLPDPTTSNPRFVAEVLITYHPVTIGS